MPESGDHLSKNKPANWDAIWRIVSAFKPYRARLAAVFVTILAMTIIGLVQPLLVRAIFDDAIPRRSVARLLFYIGLVVAVPLAINFIGLAQTMLATRVHQTVMRDLRNQLYAHLQLLPLAFYSGTRAGQIQSRFSNDLNALDGILATTGIALITSVVAALITLATMIYISPMLTIISLGLLPLIFVKNRWIERLRRPISEKRQQTMAQLSAITNESLSVSGVLLTKIFGRHEYAFGKFEKQSDELYDLGLRQAIIGRWTGLGVGLVSSLIPAAIYLFAGWQIIRGQTLFGWNMTIGRVIAYTMVQQRFLAPAGQLLNAPAALSSASVIFARIFEYLDLPVEIVNKPSAIQLNRIGIRGSVAFNNVYFSYKPGHVLYRTSDDEKKAEAAATVPNVTLKNISFKIEPGQMVALVGPSGSGKTTIGCMLSRLFDVEHGSITIDGHDLRDISIQSLTELVGVVTQEPFLLHDTVLENLRYARLDASDAEVIEAAKAAAIHDRIVSVPAGYEAVVGERGSKLSGGEKQRLAIARVILRNPRILVLDEATSSLDSVTEREIQNALKSLIRGRTALVIAHRLSTVMAADNILVLNGGEIVESGTNDELLARGGLYSRLYQQQFGHSQDDVGISRYRPEATPFVPR